MGAPLLQIGGNVPSIREVQQAADRMWRLSMSHPCHALVRPPRVRSGAVLDAVAPLELASRQAARDHYRGGGIVRLHARRPIDLEQARTEIRA
jgi:hypothetical protein